LYVGSLEYPQDIASWLIFHRVQVLNVAGPRDGKHCPVYDHAYFLLSKLFKLMPNPTKEDDCLYEPVIRYLFEPAVALAA